MIGAKFKKMGHVTMTMPIMGLSVITRLALGIFYLHTKFRNCRFSRSGDMITGVEI